MQLCFVAVFECWSARDNRALVGSPMPIVFLANQTFTSNYSAFNPQSSSLTAPSSALYWTHMSIETTNLPIMAYLTGAPNYLHVLRNFTGFNLSDTVTREGMFRASPGQPVTMTTLYDTIATHIYLYQPYWSGFRLDNVLSPLVTILLFQFL